MNTVGRRRTRMRTCAAVSCLLSGCVFAFVRRRVRGAFTASQSLFVFFLFDFEPTHAHTLACTPRFVSALFDSCSCASTCRGCISSSLQRYTRHHLPRITFHRWYPRWLRIMASPPTRTRSPSIYAPCSTKPPCSTKRPRSLATRSRSTTCSPTTTRRYSRRMLFICMLHTSAHFAFLFASRPPLMVRMAAPCRRLFIIMT